jgi:hypothetical protein
MPNGGTRDQAPALPMTAQVEVLWPSWYGSTFTGPLDVCNMDWGADSTKPLTWNKTLMGDVTGKILFVDACSDYFAATLGQNVNWESELSQLGFVGMFMGNIWDAEDITTRDNTQKGLSNKMWTGMLSKYDFQSISAKVEAGHQVTLTVDKDYFPIHDSLNNAFIVFYLFALVNLLTVICALYLLVKLLLGKRAFSFSTLVILFEGVVAAGFRAYRDLMGPTWFNGASGKFPVPKFGSPYNVNQYNFHAINDMYPEALSASSNVIMGLLWMKVRFSIFVRQGNREKNRQCCHLGRVLDCFNYEHSPCSRLSCIHVL